MRFFIVISIILILLGLPAGGAAGQSVEGTITGQVFNGTEGGGSVEGVEITLLTYINGVLSDTRTTAADGEGKFQFDGVNIEYDYLVTTKYMNVDYYYQVGFESGETTVYIEVGVCDTTASDDKIVIELTRKIINIDTESLLITEVYWLFNDGDRTYVGPDGVLFFQLPPGAYCFEAPEEMMIDYEILEDNVVTYLVPFPPGDRQLYYSYRLAKPDANELDIPIVIDYPADGFELMVEGENIEVSVSQLAPTEPVTTDTGEYYICFYGANFTRNEVINVHLSNLHGGSGFPLYIVGIIIGVVIVCIIVFTFIRKWKIVRR
jgi:hypothetical protein